MFDKDGKLDERSQRILSEQTIPPRYGMSPGMQELPRTIGYPLGNECLRCELVAMINLGLVQGQAECHKHGLTSDAGRKL